MVRYISLLLFIGLAWGQKEYNINHIFEQDSIYKKKFSDEIENELISIEKEINDLKEFNVNLYKNKEFLPQMENQTREEIIKNWNKAINKIINV